MVNKTDNNMSSVSMIAGNADPKDLFGNESSMEEIHAHDASQSDNMRKSAAA